jgi:hypothetical protein
LAYYQAGKQAMRAIPLAKIRTALQTNAAVVADVSGDVYQVHPETALHYEEVATDQVRVIAVSTDPYNNEASWQLALQNAGILPPGNQAVSSDPNSWTFDVPGQLKDVQDKLVAAKLFAAKAIELTSVRSGTWSELSLDQDDILLKEARVGFRATHIALALAPDIPAEAYVLNTTEKPETFWFVPLLFGFIALLGLIFAFGLYKRLT